MPARVAPASGGMGGDSGSPVSVPPPHPPPPVPSVANMASYAISSNMILVIHDNMINETNDIV
jgi:hypothetical protein